VTRLRFALIGAGRWAEVHRAALAASEATLIAVVTGSAASAERVAAGWGVAASTDLALAFGADVDAVVIASPNDLHAAHALAAIAAGKHVLIEKPMAIRAEDAARIVAAARSAGVIAAVGHEMRAFGFVERLRDALREGVIGPLLHARIALWRRPHRAGAGGWKADPQRIGSTILEEPIHYLDLARYLMNAAPTSVQGWATARLGHPTGLETLDARLDFPAAAGAARYAMVSTTIAAAGHRVDVQLIGEGGALRSTWRGMADLDPEPRVTLTLDRGGVSETLAVPQATGHAFDLPQQTRAFIAAIRGEGEVIADAVAGWEAVEVSLALEASIRSGAAVALRR
jgi:myo-inositol 2-dehydrogenase / D-chiro-inositol 1-dehydrogenase